MGWFSRKPNAERSEVAASLTAGVSTAPPRPDFDALCTSARSDPASDEAQSRLWAAVFTLPELHFVARGEMPDIRPFVGVVQDKPFVMMFTDDARAHKYAVDSKLESGAGAFGVITTSRDAAMKMVMNLARQGVYGIMINPGENGFFAPAGNVPHMLAEYGGISLAQVGSLLTLDVMDLLADRAVATRREDHFRETLNLLFALPTWYFVGDSELPDKPVLVPLADGSIVAVLFTSEPHAIAGTRWLETLGFKGPFTAIQASVASACASLERWSSKGVALAVFNQPTHPFPVKIAEAVQIARHLKSVPAGSRE